MTGVFRILKVLVLFLSVIVSAGCAPVTEPFSVKVAEQLPSQPTRTRAEVRATSQANQLLVANNCNPENYDGKGRLFPNTPVAEMNIVHAFADPTNVLQYECWTGIVIAGSQTVVSVDQGTVVWVGPLYCAQKDACRGESVIIINHGDYVHSVYSHVERPLVEQGDTVTAGEHIAFQGSSGLADFDQVYLEIHTGAPYSGDWENPWRGFGQFDNPCLWLPEGSCE